MSLSPDNRQLFVAPLAGVERQGYGSLGGGGAAVELSDALPFCTSTVLGAHPFSGLYPIVHLGQGLRTGSSFPGGEGGGRASSPSLSRVLQPLICGDESLGVVEAHDRPFHPEPSCPQDSLQDGDYPVCSLGEEWGLDGVLGSQGCVLAGSSSSRQPQVPEVHGFREGFPIHGSLFRSLHCSASFHTGHGSGISFPTSLRSLYSSVSQRLVYPGLLLDPRPPGFGLRLSVVPHVGGRCQRGQVQLGSVPAHCISGHDSGFRCFQGFSLAAESEAFINRRRISVLRRAASVILAGSARGSVLSHPSYSKGLPSHVVSPAPPPPFPPPTACYLVVVVGLVRCEEGLGNGSGVVICPGRFNHATTASSEHPD